MGFASSSGKGFAESLWPQAKPGSKPVAPRQRPANSRAIARAFMASSTQSRKTFTDNPFTFVDQ
jgi:hypothetical protein